MSPFNSVEINGILVFQNWFGIIKWIPAIPIGSLLISKSTISYNIKGGSGNPTNNI